MDNAHFERLSAQDRSFLVFDGPTTPMHVSAVLLFEDRFPRTRHGAIDVGHIRRYVEGRLHFLPRYRQRLLFTPIMRYPVWVDDARFDIAYHVRHSSLPRPGTIDQYHDLTGRLMSQPMDQSRPLWELWVVEGVSGNRTALVIKVHHCVMDGASGVEILSALMSPTSDLPEVAEHNWRPRPEPTPAVLIQNELRHHAAIPQTAVRALRAMVGDSRKIPAGIGGLWSGLRETVAAALNPADTTPLNQRVGSARRVSWARIDFEAVKAVKHRLGGTVNDVVIAAVTGALRHLLRSRRVAVDDLHVRATVPDKVRGESERASAGNRVSAWLVDLPVRERNVLQRFAKVVELTGRMKRSSQAQLIELLTDAASAFDPVLTLGVRLAAYFSPYTLIVTNVAGPPFPLYFMGARLLEAYPFAPLFHNQGLAVGVFSYNGELFVGCNADWDAVPDVDAFAAAVRRAFKDLERASMKPAAARRMANMHGHKRQHAAHG
jgi:WS/DGAT/MGAT family acyltransferase